MLFGDWDRGEKSEREGSNDEQGSDTGSRRSFLKRCATVGAVGLGLGAASEPASASHYSTVQLGTNAEFKEVNTWAGVVNEAYEPANPMAPRWYRASYVDDYPQAPFGESPQKFALTRAHSLAAGYVTSNTWAGHRIWTTGSQARTATLGIAAFYYKGASRIEMFETATGGWGRNVMDLSVMDLTAGSEIGRARAWEHSDTSALQNDPWGPGEDVAQGVPGSYMTAQVDNVTLHPNRMYGIYFSMGSEAVSTTQMTGGEMRHSNTFASQFALIGAVGVYFA